MERKANEGQYKLNVNDSESGQEGDYEESDASSARAYRSISNMSNVSQIVSPTQQDQQERRVIDNRMDIISQSNNDQAEEESEQNISMSYKAHSNNSPDDLSLAGKKVPKQLKWILVSEGNGEQQPR